MDKDKKKSYKEINKPVDLTTKINWIILLSILILVTGVIFWGFFGEIDITVQTQGALVSSGGFTELYSSTEGRIYNVGIRIGDSIEKGDIIARVEKTELINEILDLEQKIDTLDDEQIKLEKINELNNLKRKLREETFIIANENGIISELYIKKGQFVQKGDEILKLSRRGQDVKELIGVFYFPIEQGRRIIPGMQVKIDLVNINKEEYGYLLGRVENVSDFPITSQSIKDFTNIEQLGYYFSDSIVLEVTVDLIPSSDTYTGFAWTTEDGPPIIIQPGNIAIGNCIIHKIKPIQFIFPNL